MAALISVIGPQYCAPCVMDLAVSFVDDFTVTDVNGNVIFKVKESVWSLHGRRVLMDSDGNPIVTLRGKIMTMHDRWQVFRGESKKDHALIFNMRRTSAFQMETKLDVFLANNTKEDVCDFKVKGSWSERSCIVYAGESNIQKKQTSGLFGKEHFNVKVNPNVDYAFIVALIVILDQINEDAEEAAEVSGVAVAEAAAVEVAGAAAEVAGVAAAEVAEAVAAEFAGAAAAEVAGVAAAEVAEAVAAEVAGAAAAEALSFFLDSNNCFN